MLGARRTRKLADSWHAWQARRRKRLTPIDWETAVAAYRAARTQPLAA